MNHQKPFLIPQQRWRVKDEIKNSRFITTVEHTPTIEDAKAFIAEMSQEFSDANHNCWTFVAGPPGETVKIGMSDMGEPKGTAGRPMYNVLQHSKVGEITIVVTRYFGGVKLGRGGLVRAYGGCVQQALENLPTIEKVPSTQVSIVLSHAKGNALYSSLEDVSGKILETEYGNVVTYRVELPLRKVDDLKERVYSWSGTLTED